VLQVPLTVLEEVERVDRRAFLTDMAAGVIAPVVASDLIGHGFSAALRARPLPASMPRFATHLELHRGLMLARAGDQAGGTAYARAAMAALPPEKHSLTLRMLLAEIEGHQFGH
jgi:hypothetical protein